MKKITAQEIKTSVIEPGYCSGCGVCTASGAFRMQLNAHGQYEPEMLDSENTTDAVCPFANHGLNEDDIARAYFDKLSYHPSFGYYKNLYAGFVREGDYRKNGSSGGSITWFTDRLLREKKVDYVIHVKENNQAEIRFQYAVSTDTSHNAEASKSKYYPVTLEKALQYIQQHEGQYAVVGLPCFLKGINLLKKTDELFAQRIKYTISLFCGHLKTTHYLSSIIAQFNIDEKQVKHFDFRHKLPGHKASDYATKILTHDGKELIKTNKDLFGTNWGWGLFKLKACDYCDDLVGETADISFGDAWIPRYENDYAGTNMVVTRNDELDDLIKRHIQKGNLQYDSVSPEELIAGQAGGFRHRHEGLAYRLYLQQKKGEPVPEKRVKPATIKSKKRRKLYKIRMQLQEKSMASQNYINIPALKKELMPLIKKLEKNYTHSPWTRFRLKLKKWLKK